MDSILESLEAMESILLESLEAMESILDAMDEESLLKALEAMNQSWRPRRRWSPLRPGGDGVPLDYSVGCNNYYIF
jgi:hypothetical protein